jgi:hypothetical protein
MSSWPAAAAATADHHDHFYLTTLYDYFNPTSLHGANWSMLHTHRWLRLLHNHDYQDDICDRWHQGRT